MHCAHQQIAVASVLKCARQHIGVAIDTDDIETFTQQHRVKPCSSCDIKHGLGTMLMKQANEEIPQLLRSIPID